MTAVTYKVCFQSDLNNVKSILITIINFLKENLPCITDEDLFDLRLIYSELLCNAVIHGNKQDIAKQVTLKIEIERGVIYSIIKDEGIGFDYLEQLENYYSEDRILSEHGRGLQLVHSLTDSIYFNFKDNEITFNKKVGHNG